MNRLPMQLARRLGMAPWLADDAGSYHLCIDGHGLWLEPRGVQLMVRSSLSSVVGHGASLDHQALSRLMGMVTAWAAHCPQRLALTPDSELMLEAWIDVSQGDVDTLEQVLGVQVALLNVLCVQRCSQTPVIVRGPSVWLP
ncbi:CesT family type III secretion system chaperone [Pseudomonas mosselii]|uniref:CesT family type III secretion system chaperone n=1 Tax=Pseudomonas mosselii TaxID=78327 RepID=A0ABX9B5C7_9PSED|nr:CesT family type III secretion system chaperone [Pseudomonas mosselii]MBH3312232.1 CesT family type III secretion system chaperone [Pseudomonas mosselii]MBH3324640.1 CesT family type III secretion system chaperone [Pseudomonas mosselii]MCH7418796.1 CesT family type III secretion system chaperone [Pseudomonas mosselii]MCL8300540.1 CesT family type III secretion system chaperone [Pseudomonas mosselii]MCL8340181.1 CesT family type III secretion system chaperone [Pseudomonas mosselii]